MAQITLRQATAPRVLISLVPMIDVMLILLVFFMVTSTYLNLDMIPAAERGDDGETTAAAPSEGATALLIRLGADGQPAVRGVKLSLTDLQALIRTRLADAPLTPVVVLPSGVAEMQALITVMDAATQAGATRLRVIRLEAQP